LPEALNVRLQGCRIGAFDLEETVMVRLSNVHSAPNNGYLQSDAIQEETVEYPHGRHLIKVIIAYAGRQSQHTHNESRSYSASACSPNFNSPETGGSAE
jgi:hypothetical protein